MTDIIKLAREAGMNDGYSLNDAKLRRFAELATAPLRAENEAAQSAVKTLEQLGYTYHGGELWKPPLGKAPDFSLIDSLRAENEALRKEIAEIPIRSFCAPAYATHDMANMGRNDPMYANALELINTHQRFSISLVQRILRISYNRAAFMVDHAKEDAARAKEQTP